MKSEDMMATWEAEEKWKKEHPFRAFPEEVYDFFRYVIPNRIDDAWYEVKWGFQRMFRGFDDRWYWSFYSENTEQTLKALRWMQANKHGSPYTHDPDNVLTLKETEGEGEDFHKRWEEALQCMIDGFQALADEEDVFIYGADGKYDHAASEVERTRLHAIWEKGSKLFISNYRGLWD